VIRHLAQECGLRDLLTGCLHHHRHGIWAVSPRGLEAWAVRAWRWAIIWSGRVH
jgi:hypothetical protein